VGSTTHDAHQPPCILIFDSGAGGLSILQEMRRKLAGEHFDYLMDTAFFPYGNQSDSVLEKRIVELCVTAVAKLKPDMLILACNTASTLALPHLRAALEIPVVGVVPAVRVAAGYCDLNGLSEFGLLATPATVQRSYTDQLIEDFASHVTVHRFGSPILVSLAERHIAGENVVPMLSEHLQPWLDQHPDMKTIVLGCTHYPLLRELFESLWPQHTWIDSGEAVARQAQKVWQQAHTEPTPCAVGGPTTHLHWTGPDEPSGIRAYLSEFGEQTQIASFSEP
tara:strand:- start:3362 stop:4201 length:840 start_codon:yes stop_codon:yes gene_type:complete